MTFEDNFLLFIDNFRFQFCIIYLYKGQIKVFLRLRCGPAQMDIPEAFAIFKGDLA